MAQPLTAGPRHRHLHFENTSRPIHLTLKLKECNVDVLPGEEETGLITIVRLFVCSISMLFSGSRWCINKEIRDRLLLHPCLVAIDTVWNLGSVPLGDSEYLLMVLSPGFFQTDVNSELPDSILGWSRFPAHHSRPELPGSKLVPRCATHQMHRRSKFQIVGWFGRGSCMQSTMSP